MCVLTLITAFTAVIVAIVAIQQFLLAKEKFKLDLFEKRYAVFKGTRFETTKREYGRIAAG
jgi:hypothetical protein